MVWPFTKKVFEQKAPELGDQINILLKSITLPQATPTWNVGKPTKNNWCAKVAIDEGYSVSAIVYSCIEKRAKLVSSVPWFVYKKVGDTWEVDENHPLQKLIDRPNNAQSFRELIHCAVQSMDLGGNAFLTKIRAGMGNLPVELWLMDYDDVSIVRGSVNLIDSYKVAIKKTVEADDMVNLKYPSPKSPVYGMPPIMAAAKATDIDRESGIFQKVSLENRGLSDIAIKLPEGATTEQAEQVRDKIAENQTGTKNARKPIVSTGEVKQLNQTAAELDFTNSRRAIWTEICAVFGLSLSVLGMTENVNLANGEEQQKQLWVNTIIPILDLLKDQLNHQLTHDFGDDIELRFDLSNIAALQEGLDKKLTNAEKLWRMGMPLNTINQELEMGFNDVDGGDIGYLPMGILPVGYEPSDDETAEEQAKFMALIGYNKK